MEYRLTINKQTVDAAVTVTADNAATVDINGKTYHVKYVLLSSNHIHFSVNGRNCNAFVSNRPYGKEIGLNGRSCFVQDADLIEQQPRKREGTVSGPTTVTPATPAIVVSIAVKAGDWVEKGQGLVVVSAMKMESTLAAPYSGRVVAVKAAEGDKVSPGDILVDIEKSDSLELSESKSIMNTKP